MKKYTLSFMLFAVVFVCAIVVYSQPLPFSDLTSKDGKTQDSAMKTFQNEAQTTADKDGFSRQVVAFLQNDTTLSREKKHDMVDILGLTGSTTGIPYIIHFMATAYTDREYATVISLSMAYRNYDAFRIIKAMGKPAVPYVLDELRNGDTVPNILIELLNAIESPKEISEQMHQLVLEENHKNNPKKLERLNQMGYN